MKKILVTGAGGFVGSRVMQQWTGRYDLCTFPKGFLATAGEDAVRQALLQQRPDVILHTAAISDTGYCADHPEQAYRANVELPVWIARAAAETGAKLMAFSSDQVYAGVTQSAAAGNHSVTACQCVWTGQAGNGAAGAGALPERRVAARHMDVRPAGLPAAHPGATCC